MEYNTTVSQENVFASEEIIKATMQTLKPELDLRPGTSLADLLINPGGIIHGIVAENIKILKESLSIINAPDAESPDMETIEALLANMLIEIKQGEHASGKARLNLFGVTRFYLPDTYTLLSGEYIYQIDQAYEILPVGTEPTAGVAHTYIEEDARGYYCILPFTAQDVGIEYNLEAGDALFFSTGTDTYSESAEVYVAFTGGSNPETLEEVNERLPDMLSNNTFTTPAGITRTLMTNYDNIYSVSPVGMGFIEQSRGRHNIFNIDVGGRVDAYVRPYRNPEVSSVIVEAARYDSEGRYVFTVTADDLDGIYRIRAVNSIDSLITEDSGTSPLLGSYPFEFRFTTNGIAEARHDFSTDPDQLIMETSYTRWSGMEVVVGPVNQIIPGTPSTLVYPETIQVEVEYYTIPKLGVIQDYMDSRTSESDLIVRGGIPIFISFTAYMYLSPGVTVDHAAVKQALADYINAKNIGEALSISELSSVAHSYDIRRIEFTARESVNFISGSIIDVDGTEHDIIDDTIDPEVIAGLSTYFSEHTAYVAADTRDLFVAERRI